MGLFDKKYCDICGEKIGLLGNRKLEDGNLCKDCAKKLSPWFNERRSSTVSEIREQLDWREANMERAARFNTTRSFGERTKLLLDETQRWFTVTRSSNPSDDNSDVLNFSDITGCRMDIDESRTELKMETKNREGKIERKSYSPPRYEYDYDFYIIVSVNTPFFNEIKFKLNDDSVYIPYRPARSAWGGGIMGAVHEEPMYDYYYRSYKEMGEEICRLMEYIRSNTVTERRAEKTVWNGNSCIVGAADAKDDLRIKSVEDAAFAKAIRDMSWVCPSCRCANSGTETCRNCGAPLSDSEVIENARNLAYAAVHQHNVAQSWKCDFCGTINKGKFCENCGAKRP